MAPMAGTGGGRKPCVRDLELCGWNSRTESDWRQRLQRGAELGVTPRLSGRLRALQWLRARFAGDWSGWPAMLLQGAPGRGL